MKSDEIKALEKVFAAEVQDRLPFQSKAAIYKRLAEFGLVETMDRVFAVPPLGNMTVTGWALTHKGRIAYCETCPPPESQA